MDYKTCCINDVEKDQLIDAVNEFNNFHIMLKDLYKDSN